MFLAVRAGLIQLAAIRVFVHAITLNVMKNAALSCKFATKIPAANLSAGRGNAGPTTFVRQAAEIAA